MGSIRDNMDKEIRNSRTAETSESIKAAIKILRDSSETLEAGELLKRVQMLDIDEEFDEQLFREVLLKRKVGSSHLYGLQTDKTGRFFWRDLKPIKKGEFRYPEGYDPSSTS